MLGFILLALVAWVVVSILVGTIFGQAISHHMNATAHDMPEGE